MPRTISVEIVGDATSLEKSFAKASRDANRFGRGMERQTRRSTGALRGFTRMAGFATAAIGTAGLAGAVKASFDEMLDAQKVAAQTQAVLKSTGGQAGVTADHVDKLGTRLLNLTGIDDETVKSTENLLLTFTKIGARGGVFDDATKTVLDMSVALGEDTKSAAIQLGKALQDPIKGITALRRVGVNFTEAQRDQIKALVASGHELEAQRLILKELQTEFGGSAKAAGDTFAGSLNKLREQAKNLGGEIAQTLAPSIERVVKRISAWLSSSRNQKQVLDAVKQAVAAVSDAAKVLTGVFRALNSITGSTKRTLELLFAALIVFKTAKLVSTFAGIASNIGLIGTNAAASALSVRTLGIALAAGLAAQQLFTQRERDRQAGEQYRKRGAFLFGPGEKARIGERRTLGGKPYVVEQIGGQKYLVPVHIEHFHSSAQNPRQFENELMKRARARGHVRRGSR